jgi:pimeloyl-ACP methyl ester carboxylesterase
MKVDIGGGIRLFVDIEGAKYVVRDGELVEKPTLILLHGGPGYDHTAFKPKFSALSDICQIVYYDHRGNGRSDWGDKELWNLDVWADDLVRLCDVLGIEKPIVLGNSFGGMVAMAYLIRHPEHAAKVVLSSTAAKMDLPAVYAMFNKLGGAEAEEIATKFWTDPSQEGIRDDYLRVCGPLYTQSDGNALGAPYTVRNAEVGAHFILGEQKRMNLIPGLEKAQCPVLLLAGAWDPVCPVSVMEEIRAALPAEHVQWELFEHCGHGVFRDDPEGAFTLLRDFILQ